MGAQRTQAFRDTVQQFMIDTLGKKYRVNATALMGNKEKNDHLKENINMKAGFFCSELVACLLKQLGLLNLDQPSTQYWPGNFSTENPKTSIRLLEEAFYSDELTLDFEI